MIARIGAPRGRMEANDVQEVERFNAQGTRYYLCDLHWGNDSENAKASQGKQILLRLTVYIRSLNATEVSYMLIQIYLYV
jgi:hypothetical protein